MLLAAEIKAAQELGREQQEFLIQNAPENIKVKARGQEDEFSPENSNSSIKLPNTDLNRNSVNSLHNLRPNTHHKTSNIESSHYKSYPIGNIKNGYPSPSVQGSKRKSPTTVLNMSSDSMTNETHETRLKTLALDDSSSPRSGAPNFSYSPSSPGMHRPSVFRSPLKFNPASRRLGRVVVPPEVSPNQGCQILP